MILKTIEADYWKMDGGVAFGVIPKSLWTKVYQEDTDNLVKITTRCLLIQHNDRNILIDTGMGDKRDEKYYSYKFRFGDSGLIQTLEKAGLSPAGITDILFTHLHDDHVGGATQIDSFGEITGIFENAQYWCSETQWEWSKKSNKREAAAFFRDNLDPLEKSGRLNLIKTEGTWLPGIELRIFNGHTRGLIVPLIKAFGNTIVYAADFIPARAYIPVSYVASVDIEPLLSLKEKEIFLEEAEKNGYILLFEHDYYNEACRLTRTEKGVTAGEALEIKNLCN